jgi:hypothetical protein
MHFGWQATEKANLCCLSRQIYFRARWWAPLVRLSPLLLLASFALAVGGSQFWVSDPSIVRDSYDEMGLLFRLVLLEIALLPFEMAGREVLPPC